ncbi:MAG: T9SS type B sorting domain-containing protein, partial [Flavobacteriales bacterium]
DVKVFNRYGQIVYETRDIKEIVWESDISPVGAGWDGNFRNEAGKELDPGVYVYVIELYNKSGEVKNLKGNVTLVR